MTLNSWGRRGLLLLLLACAAGAAGAGDWPMLMGGPARAGRVAGAAAPRELALAWKLDLHAQISASPVVAGGRLLVGAENGNLYAFALDTRKLLWLFHAGGGIASTPAVADGLVYVLSRDGIFHALDAASGAPRWSFRTQGEAIVAAHGMYGQPLGPEPVPDPWDFYLSSPLVHAGKVYFGSSDQRVYALDARSGQLLWAYKTGGVVHSSPALAGGNIVVGSWDGAVYALDAASGERRWRFETRTEQKQSIMLGIQASPSTDADSVYIGSRDGYFYALDAASGRQKWRYDAQGSWVPSTAAQDEASVYVGTSDTGLLLALDKRSGQERFRYASKVWNFASPLRVGDAVLGASTKGELFMLDAESGALRWRYQSAESRADAFGILAADGGFDNARLFGSTPQQFHAALEHVKRLGAFLASPLYHDGLLIAANANGEVLAFAPARR